MCKIEADGSASRGRWNAIVVIILVLTTPHVSAWLLVKENLEFIRSFKE